MAGRSWELGRARACRTLAALGLLLTLASCEQSSACRDCDTGSGGLGANTEEPSIPPGATSSGGSVGVTGGAAGVGEGVAAGANVTCALNPVNDPVFAAQVINDQTLARAELFSWATDEEAAALRADRDLLPSGAAPADLQQALVALRNSSDPSTAVLAASLNKGLVRSRIAWPEPWSLRITEGGQDAGKNLVRIVLKPEAWIVVVKSGALRVVDLDNRAVPLADAAEAPGRIGAIYNQRDLFENGVSCSQGDFTGTTPGTGIGVREFVVSNPDMVGEWSLGTQAIKDRLQANIDQLGELLARTRSCPTQDGLSFWQLQVICNWDVPLALPAQEQLVYEQALAIPTRDYYTAPMQLGALIEALRGALFEPDPLQVSAENL